MDDEERSRVERAVSRRGGPGLLSRVAGAPLALVAGAGRVLVGGPPLQLGPRCRSGESRRSGGKKGGESNNHVFPAPNCRLKGCEEGGCWGGDCRYRWLVRCLADQREAQVLFGYGIMCVFECRWGSLPGRPMGQLPAQPGGGPRTTGKKGVTCKPG